jgi:cell division protein FtsB
MKNKKLKRNRSKKKLVAVALSLLLALLAVGAYFQFVKDDSISVSQEEQKSAEQADVDAAKQRIEEESQNEPLKDDGSEEEPVVSGTISLSALTFSQGGGLVNTSVNVEGADSGTCAFVFTDADGRAITKTTKLSGASCTISVSEAEFTMIGEYNLVAKFGDKSLSKTVNIN